MTKGKIVLNFLKSLQFRLIVIFIVLAILPGAVIHIGLIKSYEARALQIRQSEVLSQAKILSNQIATKDMEQIEADTALLSQIDSLTSLYDGRVMLVNNALRIVLDTYNLDDGKTMISEEVIKSASGETKVLYDSNNRYIEMSIPVINPDGKIFEIKFSQQCGRSQNQFNLCQIRGFTEDVNITLHKLTEATTLRPVCPPYVSHL